MYQTVHQAPDEIAHCMWSNRIELAGKPLTTTEQAMRSDKAILLVEDDMVDAIAVKRALKDVQIENELVTVTNGEEALDYLEDVDEMPCLVLLDLNMPKMNGLEFLDHVKQEDRYRSIPIIVFTTSKEEQDRLKSFELGIAGYMVKPIDHPQFVEIMRVINNYWTVSEFPD